MWAEGKVEAKVEDEVEDEDKRAKFFALELRRRRKIRRGCFKSHYGP